MRTTEDISLSDALPGTSSDEEPAAKRERGGLHAAATRATSVAAGAGTSLDPAPRRAKHPRLHLAAAGALCVLCVLAGLVYPFFFVASLTPVLGLFAIPSLLGLTVFLLYGVAAIPYLLFAQDDPPQGFASKLCFVPLSPIRAALVVRTLFARAKPTLALRLHEVVFDFAFKRIVSLGRAQLASPFPIRQGVLYGSDGVPGQRLDIYTPANFDGISAAAPVICFVHGGGALTNRNHYVALALRLRRMNICVAVVDVRQYPECRVRSSVADLRNALSWLKDSAHRYGGDGSRLFVMGHGSGAHLAALTVTQDAVVRARDELWLDGGEHAANEVFKAAPGLKRLEIWGSNSAHDLPKIEGMILLSGFYDPVKQLRLEVRRGIEQFSTLRRSLGGSHSDMLKSSPAHMLYAARSLPKIALPPRCLIVHGGEDESVPLTQSVLLKSVLTGAGADVRLCCFRELSHLESLICLLRPRRSRYSRQIVTEILNLVHR